LSLKVFIEMSSLTSFYYTVLCYNKTISQYAICTDGLWLYEWYMVIF